MDSRLHCGISSAQVKDIAAYLLGDGVAVSEYRLLGGGLFNTTYFIETDCPKKKLVVRIAPINRQFLYPFEQNMMKAEPALQRMMADIGIPTTRIVQYVPAGEVIDREYSVSEYVPFIPMNDSSLKDIDLSYLYEDIGFYMKLIHEIKIDGFGWPQPIHSPNSYSYSIHDSNQKFEIPKNEFLAAPHDNWYDFLVEYANENILRMGELDYISQGEASGQLEILEKYRSLFDKVTESRMTHTDLWQGNVLLQKDESGERYQIGAVIDADRAIFGDREFDFAMGWMYSNGFEKGYQRAGTPYILTDEEKEEACIKREIYSLLYDFFGVYIFSTQFDEVDGSKHYVKQIREKYNNLLK